MKLKAGDRVTVRKDLKTGWYGAELVVPEMLVLAGEEVEVKRICESDNTLFIVGSTWNWTPEMFEETPSEVPEEKPSEITLEICYRHQYETFIRKSFQTVVDDDCAYENACEQFLEDYETEYGSAEKINICFVREAFDNA